MKKQIITPFFLILFINYSLFAFEDPIRQQFIDNGVVPLSSLKRIHHSTQEIKLGKLLFFDKILSGNKNISCSSCHHPTLASGDALALPFGEGGKGLGRQRQQGDSNVVPRNAPDIFNRGFPDFEIMMWDGRIAITDEKGIISPEPGLNGHKSRKVKILEPIRSTLGLQALFPLTSHDEMRGHGDENELSRAKDNFELWSKIEQRIRSVNEYVDLFKDSYPDIHNSKDIHIGHVANSIAAYETFAFDASQTKFDLYLRGEIELNEFEREGADIFLNKGRCISCHNGPFLTDSKFHNIAVPKIGPGKKFNDDFGLFLQTQKVEDIYKFKTPPLRNVEVTGPWMHNGFFSNLKSLIKHHTAPQESFLDCLESPEKHVKSPLLLESLDRNPRTNQLRVDLVDHILLNVEPLNDIEVEQVYSFLLTLTDLSFESKDLIPDKVPSGLPLD